MAAPDPDWLVLGTSPLAHLLAGQLATAHGARVVLAGELYSEWALPRGLDLSVLPATRPESWALLAALVPETLALLRGLGAGESIVADSPVLVGETGPTLEALQHMRHVAIGYGQKVDRIADVEIGEGAVGYRFLDGHRLERRRLMPALAAWLERSGVRQLVAPVGALTLRRDGSARLSLEGETVIAKNTVFADDAAILAAAGVGDGALLATPARVVLTEPAPPQPAAAMTYYDRGVTLEQRGDGSIVAQLLGRRDDALARLGVCLTQQGPLRRAAEADFEVLTTLDGAPLLGNAKGSRAALFGGFGPAAAFLAPALARWLAGTASGAEAAYLAAHAAGKPGSRPAVADFVTPRLMEPA